MSPFLDFLEPPRNCLSKEMVLCVAQGEAGSPLVSQEQNSPPNIVIIAVLQTKMSGVLELKSLNKGFFLFILKTLLVYFVFKIPGPINVTKLISISYPVI